MPKLGETVTEGELTNWLKNVGDPVAFDDPLFEVSTDKVDSEIPSPYDGVIAEIMVQTGETVAVGTAVVRIVSAEQYAAGGAGIGAARRAGRRAPAPAAAAPAPAAAAAAPSGAVYDITMPKLGETVTEGTVSTWLKKVGDPVAFDDALYEVSTDKVDSEIPSPYDGVLLEVLVNEGDTVPVGTVLARIGEPGSAPGPAAAPPAPAPAASAAPGARRGRRRWRRPVRCGRRPRAVAAGPTTAGGELAGRRRDQRHRRRRPDPS